MLALRSTHLQASRAASLQQPLAAASSQRAAWLQQQQQEAVLPFEAALLAAVRAAIFWCGCWTAGGAHFACEVLSVLHTPKWGDIDAASQCAQPRRLPRW